MAFTVPSRAEIEARLDRATRSVLASSSISVPSSTAPLPSLEDLILHNASSSPFRCRACNAGLLRGAKSIFCMFCGAPQPASFAFQKFSFRSSLALKRFLDSHQLSSLESELGAEEVLMPSQIPDMTKEHVVSTSVESGLSKMNLDPIRKVGENEGRALEYSQKLKGISLEDFFLNKMHGKESEYLAAASSKLSQTVNTSNLDDADYWVSASANESVTDNQQMYNHQIGGHSQEEVEDDTFSWEGEFQSAEPVNQPLVQGMQQLENVSFETEQWKSGPEVEAANMAGDVSFKLDSSIPNAVQLSVSQNDQLWTGTSSTPVTASKVTTEFDTLFVGPSWQHDRPSDLFGGLTADDPFMRSDNASIEINPVDSGCQWNQTDMLLGRQDMGSGSTSEQIMFSSLQDISGTDADAILSTTSRKDELQALPPEKFAFSNQQQQSIIAGKKVESLVAQMHDLSFMLSDSISNSDPKARKWREDL